MKSLIILFNDKKEKYRAVEVGHFDYCFTFSAHLVMINLKHLWSSWHISSPFRLSTTDKLSALLLWDKIVLQFSASELTSSSLVSNKSFKWRSITRYICGEICYLWERISVFGRRSRLESSSLSCLRVAAKHCRRINNESSLNLTSACIH